MNAIKNSLYNRLQRKGYDSSDIFTAWQPRTAVSFMSLMLAHGHADGISATKIRPCAGTD
jgi:hypothetical protein